MREFSLTRVFSGHRVSLVMPESKVPFESHSEAVLGPLHLRLPVDRSARQHDRLAQCNRGVLGGRLVPARILGQPHEGLRRRRRLAETPRDGDRDEEHNVHRCWKKLK